MPKRKFLRKVAESDRKANVLTALAHYDKGTKQPGCDCLFCSPKERQGDRG